jgi:protocatechuate 4,5-dioxygenase beta chain
MARIVGAVATSHIPMIGKAIANGWQSDPYFKPFFDAYGPIHEWLAAITPDVAIVVYNDHGLNFFLDKMPTFAVGAAPEYRNADEGWGLPVVAPFPGHPRFSWHLIESLTADEFDLTTCQEMLVDHGFAVPITLLWPGTEPRPIRTIPISVNTVQFPLPTPARCYKLGRALGRAIESFDEDVRVLVVGSGGLSHQLDGKRAGFLNKAFDLMCLEKIVSDPESITNYSAVELARESGAQGVELLNWLVMRGALTGEVVERQSRYHAPISNTASAVLALENRTAVTARRSHA